MNRLVVGVTAILMAGCQAAAPASPSSTLAPSVAPPTATPTRAPTPPPTLAPTATATFATTAELVAFNRSTPDGFQLMLVDALGGPPRPLSKPDLQVPRWSPDGEWIAVAQPVDDDTVHLVLIRPDGTDQHTVDADATLSMGASAWTPDGVWLAAESWDPTDEIRAGVHVVKADGSGLRRLGPPGIPGAFSADGRQLVYSVGADEERHLAVINFDGSGYRQLGTTAVDAYPGFMPDGSIYDTTGGAMGIFDPDGNLLHTVNAPGGSINEARLSPDGTRFVFIYYAPGADGAIASMAVDGSNFRIVVPVLRGGEQVAPDWKP